MSVRVNVGSASRLRHRTCRGIAGVNSQSNSFRSKHYTCRQAPKFAVCASTASTLSWVTASEISIKSSGAGSFYFMPRSSSSQDGEKDSFATHRLTDSVHALRPRPVNVCRRSSSGFVVGRPALRFNRLLIDISALEIVNCFVGRVLASVSDMTGVLDAPRGAAGMRDKRIVSGGPRENPRYLGPAGCSRPAPLSVRSAISTRRGQRRYGSRDPRYVERRGTEEVS